MWCLLRIQDVGFLNPAAGYIKFPQEMPLRQAVERRLARSEAEDGRRAIPAAGMALVRGFCRLWREWPLGDGLLSLLQMAANPSGAFTAMVSSSWAVEDSWRNSEDWRGRRPGVY